MKTQELIKILSELPQELEVCVWDDDKDDYVPVIDAVWEGGHTTIDLVTDQAFSIKLR